MWYWYFTSYKIYRTELQLLELHFPHVWLWYQRRSGYIHNFIRLKYNQAPWNYMCHTHIKNKIKLLFVSLFMAYDESLTLLLPANSWSVSWSSTSPHSYPRHSLHRPTFCFNSVDTVIDIKLVITVQVGISYNFVPSKVARWKN